MLERIIAMALLCSTMIACGSLPLPERFPVTSHGVVYFHEENQHVEYVNRGGCEYVLVIDEEGRMRNAEIINDDASASCENLF